MAVCGASRESVGVRMEENITIEFVRNWIEKHHLTRKSYESVLTDALTNNGHYYIDNPYLRDWIRENTEMFRNILPYELNETQQVVLEWLKDDFKEYGDPIIAIGDLGDEILPSRWETCLQATYEKLDTQQKWEVLTAFVEWGKEAVAE